MKTQLTHGDTVQLGAGNYGDGHDDGYNYGDGRGHGYGIGYGTSGSSGYGRGWGSNSGDGYGYGIDYGFVDGGGNDRNTEIFSLANRVTLVEGLPGQMVNSLV